MAQQPVRSSSEVMDQAREILSVIAHHGLRPILVLDDTDKWVSAAWSPHHHQVRRQGFFGSVVRTIAEEFDVATVVAVHPTYLEDEAFQQARGFLATTVQVPRLPGPDAVQKVLHRRASLCLAGDDGDVPLAVDHLVEPDAADLLYGYYERSHHGDVRRTVLLVAHTALTRAVDSGHTSISRSAVETAISEVSPD